MSFLVMPFALWIGVTRILNTMNADSELVVLEAAGASRRYVFKPVIALSVLMSVVGILIAHFAEPWASTRFRDIINDASTELFSSAVRSGEFTEIKNGVHVQISEERSDGSFGGLLIADQRDPNLEIIYYARTGFVLKELSGSFIVMNDGEIHQKPADTGAVSTVRFESYVLDLAFFGQTRTVGSYKVQERSTAALLSPEPDDRLFEEQPDAFREEIHSRFSEWIYPLVFGLIAVYFTGKTRSSRQANYLNTFFAAVSVFGVRGIGFFVISQAGNSLLFASLAYAVPLASIVVVLALIARDW
jgi:lipopolysaccharide export system permease protein